MVEPFGDLHKGPNVFDFSNMKVGAGTSTLVVVIAMLAALSYFCRRRIISKLKRGQAPFFPTQPAPAAPAPAPVPAAAYNQATGLALLPDINYQTMPQPYRGLTQDFCSFPPAAACYPPQPQLCLAFQQDSLQWRTSTGSSLASDCLLPTTQVRPCPPPTKMLRTWRTRCAASTRTRSKSHWLRPPTPPRSRGGGAHGSWGRGEEI